MISTQFCCVVLVCALVLMVLTWFLTSWPLPGAVFFLAQAVVAALQVKLLLRGR